MLKDSLHNPLIVLHAFVITLWLSTWTLIELWIHKIPRQTLDDRLRRWAKRLLAFIDLTYSVHNPHRIELEKGRPYLIMCNHCSHYDIPLSLIALPGSIRMLAKKELLEVPIWGRAMKMTEFVSIDRFNPRQALQDMKYAKLVMEKGILLWIAPEGTRSPNGELQPFKPGGFRLAIESGATIIPLGIVGSSQVMQAKSFVIHRGKSVTIHIGRPIDASTYSKKQRDLLMRDVENEIRRLISTPVQDSSTH